MTTTQLTRKIVIRLGKIKFLILLSGIAMGALLYFYAKSKPVLYTCTAKVYPVTENGGGSSGGLLSSLTGSSSIGSNLSQEAAITLEDLAQSRRIREEVAMERLLPFQNQTVASLLIQNANKYLPFYATKMEIPKSELDLKAIGAYLIQEGLVAKSNKNGLFIVNFTSSNKELISPITYIFIDKLSQFYISLKIKKAQSDFNFSLRKIDSLRAIMYAYDRRAIALNKTTMFVPPERIEFSIPKENLINDKTRVVGIYNGASNNKEEALWRLQRATPILEILDKPDPPFDQKVKSKSMYAAIGFFAGCILAAIFFILDILFRYSKNMVTKSLFANEDVEIVEESVTVVDDKNEKIIVAETNV